MCPAWRMQPISRRRFELRKKNILTKPSRKADNGVRFPYATFTQNHLVCLGRCDGVLHARRQHAVRRLRMRRGRQRETGSRRSADVLLRHELLCARGRRRHLLQSAAVIATRTDRRDQNAGARMCDGANADADVVRRGTPGECGRHRCRDAIRRHLHAGRAARGSAVSLELARLSSTAADRSTCPFATFQRLIPRFLFNA